MSRFCYQCQETANGKGQELRSIAAKAQEAAKLKDVLIYAVKGIAEIVTKACIESSTIPQVNYEVLKSLFMMISSANFDDSQIEAQIQKMLRMRQELSKDLKIDSLHSAAQFVAQTKKEILEKSSRKVVLAIEDEDISCLRQRVVYGVESIAFYAYYALDIGFKNEQIYDFIYKALAATLDDSMTVEDLASLIIETVKIVDAMEVLNNSDISQSIYLDIEKPAMMLSI